MPTIIVNAGATRAPIGEHTNLDKSVPDCILTEDLFIMIVVSLYA